MSSSRLASYVMKRDSVTLEVDDDKRTVALWQDRDGLRTPLPSPEWSEVETMPMAYDWLDALDMDSLR